MMEHVPSAESLQSSQLVRATWERSHAEHFYSNPIDSTQVLTSVSIVSTTGCGTPSIWVYNKHTLDTVVIFYEIFLLVHCQKISNDTFTCSTPAGMYPAACGFKEARAEEDGEGEQESSARLYTRRCESNSTPSYISLLCLKHWTSARS